MNENEQEKLYDLLCTQAVYGLNESETKEIAQIASTADGNIDVQSLELTVAMLSLADLNADEPMPEHLESRILADFNQQNAGDQIHESIHDMQTREIKWIEPASRPSFLSWFGWAVAAAACVALAANVYLTRIPTPTIAEGPKPPVKIKLTPLQERDRLIASATDIARADWVNPDKNSPNKLSGDVVWSDSKQAGYARVSGLPANDPNKETYQLWIFDETQDEKTPIDGGTFNVNAAGEIVIPINAHLKTRNPKAFAITVEKPGGVVVSERDKIAALAPVKPNQA